MADLDDYIPETVAVCVACHPHLDEHPPDEVIRAAARRLAANKHPDRGDDEREFKKIQNGKEALLDA